MRGIFCAAALAVTAEQLQSAKNYIKGQYPPNIETSRQLAQMIATNEFCGLGDEEVNQLEARVDAVTPEIARQVIPETFSGREPRVCADREGLGD